MGSPLFTVRARHEGLRLISCLPTKGAQDFPVGQFSTEGANVIVFHRFNVSSFLLTSHAYDTDTATDIHTLILEHAYQDFDTAIFSSFQH